MLRHLATAALAVALITAPGALASDRGHAARANVETLAVIGDTPYGDAQVASFRLTSRRSTSIPRCAV